jgi:hypothetical protein
MILAEIASFSGEDPIFLEASGLLETLENRIYSVSYK